MAALVLSLLYRPPFYLPPYYAYRGRGFPLARQGDYPVYARPHRFGRRCPSVASRVYNPLGVSSVLSYLSVLTYLGLTSERG